RFDLTSYLHPAEQRDVAALEPVERAAAMLSCWVRKDAYLKGVGSGIAAGVGVDYVELGATFARDSTGAEPALPSGWTILDVPVPTGFAAATAARHVLPQARRGSAVLSRCFALDQAFPGGRR